MEPEWLAAVGSEAAHLLGLAGPLVFHPALVELFKSELVFLDEERIPEGPYSTPAPEFGVLGADMPDYFNDYEFDEYLSGAWPIALDGAGGFYCLDLRSVIAGTALNDGAAPLVWSHSGNLGWNADEHVLIATDLPAFLAVAVTGRQ